MLAFPLHSTLFHYWAFHHFGQLLCTAINLTFLHGCESWENNGEEIEAKVVWFGVSCCAGVSHNNTNTIKWTFYFLGMQIIAVGETRKVKCFLFTKWAERDTSV